MSDSQLAIAKTPAELTAYLTRGKSAIEAALPKHLNPDRMLRIAVTCWSTTPALRNCTPQSILASIVVASQLGLEPGIGGQAYLIPYKNTCTLVPGWQGIVSLLNNSGRATAWTGAVYEGDTWEFELGSTPKCRHIPGDNYGDPDKMIWVYACGQVNGSEKPVIEAWPISRVWRHRDKFNKVGNRHYSFTHPEMYARKVVLLQVLKYMPRSIELANAMVASDAVEMGRTVMADRGMIIEMPSEEEATPSAEEMVGRREPVREERRENRAEERAPIETQAEPVESRDEPAGDSDIRASLLKKLDARMVSEGVTLKFFVSAAVGHIPSMSASTKLLSELSTDALDTVDSNLDEIIKIAKSKQEKAEAKAKEAQ